MGNWGLKIKELREQRNLDQAELSRRSGLSQSHISRIERGDYASMSPTVEEKLARGFRISRQSLREVIYAEAPELENLEEILEKLRLVTPIQVPVYTVFPYVVGQGIKSVENVYVSRSENGSLESYKVPEFMHGVEPEVRSGDIIVVDKNHDLKSGDFVVFIFNNSPQIGILRNIVSESWIENSQGRVKLEAIKTLLPITQVVRKYK